MKAYLDLTLAMVISGSSVVISKMMVNTIPTFLATELGIFVGLLILLIITFIIKKEYYSLDFKTFLIVFMQALCGIFLYRVLTFWGLSYTSAANSGLITSSTPAVIILLAFIILKEKITFYGFVGLSLILIGLFSINLYTYFSEGAEHNSTMGNLLILLAVVCEALFSVFSKLKCKYMSPLYRTTIIVLCAFLCLLPFAIYDSCTYDVFKIPPKTIGCILYYGVFVSFLSYVLWFKGIEKTKASIGAMFTSVVPVSSILLANLLLGERIFLIHIGGMLFIIGGIIISTLRTKTIVSL